MNSCAIFLCRQDNALASGVFDVDVDDEGATFPCDVEGCGKGNRGCYNGTSQAALTQHCRSKKHQVMYV
jgi:hypothetical protein